MAQGSGGSHGRSQGGYFLRRMADTFQRRLLVIIKFILRERSHRLNLIMFGIPHRGDYPGVLDYKFIQIQELNNFHFWALLFWDKLIMQIGFHDPQCFCEKCFSATGQPT